MPSGSTRTSRSAMWSTSGAARGKWKSGTASATGRSRSTSTAPDRTARSASVPAQGRPVADGPGVAERIGEAALTVRAPGHVVVLDARPGGGAGRDGAFDDLVGVIGEQLYAGARDA